MALIQYDWCPPKEGALGHSYIEKEESMKTQERDSHLQAKENNLEKILPHSPQKEPMPPTP